MHPLIQEQLNTIQGRLDELRTALDEERERGRSEAAKREAMLQEHWRERKRAATLEHMAEDLEAVQSELELYETERAATAESLQNVLARLKGLRGYLAD